MEKESAYEVLACLTQERTCFHYFRDFFALQLLGYVAGDGIAIEHLRRGSYARLLNKPPVRRILASCGDGRLSAARLSAHWDNAALPFLLTLGLWQNDRYWYHNQTSRPGYNLVLRLNFTREHDRSFHKLLAPYQKSRTLNYTGHPVLRPRERRYFRETLAWTRLDVDLIRGEALVEEIQTDWLRVAAGIRRRLPGCERCPRSGHDPVCRRVATARLYLDQVLTPYRQIWDEAMLSATIFFLIEELGVRSIWYHSWISGNAFKGIGGGEAPPRSLYTSLPRSFCFNEVEAIPHMLDNRHTAKRLRRIKVKPRFFHLQL